jgi:acylphosphatase
MNDNLKRAEIIAYGLVQGVGFRYFVYRNAKGLGLKGFVQNLYSGEVLTVVEGEEALIEDLFLKIKVGPMHADVRNCKISWDESKNEFSDFQIKGW